MAWVSPPWLTIFAYKGGILVESTIWERECRECVRVKWREEERKRSCCHGQQSVWAESWVILLHVFIVTFSLSLIQWLSPVDVGDFAEPRKILCQCALPSVEKDQNTPGPRMGQPEFPNINNIDQRSLILIAIFAVCICRSWMWITRKRGLQIILTLLLGQAQEVLWLQCSLLRMLKNDQLLQQKILSSFIGRRVNSYFLKPPNKMKTMNFSMMKLRSNLSWMKQETRSSNIIMKWGELNQRVGIVHLIFYLNNIYNIIFFSEKKFEYCIIKSMWFS